MKQVDEMPTSGQFVVVWENKNGVFGGAPDRNPRFYSENATRPNAGPVCMQGVSI